MVNHTIDELNEEYKKAVQEKLDAMLSHAPSVLRKNVLRYIEEFGIVLSPEKMYKCIQIIALIEELSVPLDEEQRAVNAAYMVQKHEEECPHCNSESEGLSDVIISMLSQRFGTRQENQHNEDLN